MSKSKTPRRGSREAAGRFESLSPLMQDVICIGAVYVVVLLVFGGLVFKNTVFSSGGDFANHYSYKHVGDRIEETEGVDALWTPFVFGGMPTFGNLSYVPVNVSYLETIVVSVIQLLFLNSPQSNLIVHIFLGGVFMFWLLREWKFSRLEALFAGLTFMLSPYAVSLGETGHGSKMMALYYLPLLILLVHYLFEKRSLLSFGALCAGVGTLMLTRHVQMVYYVFAVMGLYLLYEIIRSVREDGRRAVRNTALFVAALAVGLCISSYIYLSVLEYAQFSIRGGGTEGSSGGLTWEYATNWSMRPVELVTLLIPSFFGFKSPYYWGAMPFTSSTVYLGIIPVFLSLLAVAYRRDRLALFFMVLTGIVLLMSFGKYIGFLYQLLLDYLPFFNKFRAPSTILHLLPFTLGVLAAFGIASLREIAGDERRGRLLIKILVIVIVTLGSLLIIGATFKTSLYQSLSSSMLVKDGEFQLYQQQYGARARQIIAQLKQIRFFGNEEIAGLWGDYVRFSLLGILSTGLAVLFLRKSIGREILVAGLTVILVVDLSLIDAKFIDPVPAKTAESAADSNFQPPGPAIVFLAKQPGLFRVFPVGANLFGDNSYAYHGIQSLGGYNAAKLKIYQTLLDSCMYHQTVPGVPVNTSVVDMLNARYVVAGFSLPPSHFRPVYRDEQQKVTVYENPGALPRAFFVDSITVVGSDEDTFTALNSPTFDPSVTAILRERPAETPSAPESTSVSVTEYKSRSIRMSAFTTSPALLVLSEIYYPAGWMAAIDGTPADIYRTNSILRSVVVPAGSHEVVFAFDPASYEQGKVITNAAWVFTFVCLAAGWGLPRFRKRKGDRKNPGGNGGRSQVSSPVP